VQLATNLGFFFNLDALNFAILLLAFALDILGKILVPITFSFAEGSLVKVYTYDGRYGLFWSEHIFQENAFGRQLLGDVRFHADSQALVRRSMKIMGVSRTYQASWWEQVRS
jgi:hypothetical protein